MTGEPQDPFELHEAEARLLFTMMQTFMKHGFRRAEAFQLIYGPYMEGAKRNAGHRENP